MFSPVSSRRAAALATLALVVAASSASAQITGLYVFGDSLSDGGNNALALASVSGTPNGVPQVVPGNTYIPSFAYAPQTGWNNVAGLATYSDGHAWVTPFAAAIGVNTAPSLMGGGNFAFGGARVSVNGTSNGFPYSLATQAGMFLNATGGTAPATGLYVVAGGGNDARDALQSLGATPTQEQINATISSAATQYALGVSGIVNTLQAAGAVNIVVWNVPDLGKAPAVTANGPQAAALATAIAQAMNQALAFQLAGEQGVSIFDLYGTMQGIVANPTAFGLVDVSNVYTAGSGIPREDFLFWDGIHPTAAGHQLIASAMVAHVVPEPGTVALVVVGLAAFGLAARRRRAA